MASDNGSFHDVLLTVNEKKIHFVRFLLKPKNISKPGIMYQLYTGSVRTVKYHDLGIENAELYQYISRCEPPDQRITYIIFPMSPHNHQFLVIVRQLSLFSGLNLWLHISLTTCPRIGTLVRCDLSILFCTLIFLL